MSKSKPAGPDRPSRCELSAREAQFVASWFHSECVGDPVLADAALRGLTGSTLGNLAPSVDLAGAIAAQAWYERHGAPERRFSWRALRSHWARQVESAVAHPACRAATGATLFVTSLVFAVSLVALAQAFAGTTPQELVVRSSGFAATFVELLTLAALLVGVVVDGVGEVISAASGPGGLVLATSLTLVLAVGLSLAIRHAPRTVQIRD